MTYFPALLPTLHLLHSFGALVGGMN
ncbi:rCG52011 [Rattus norvegicus]|uniref:RCG52011 n=1 Tax=Rattus norvegicus TaxID=10116 RepID=A6K306_RAT|nr:rCG52011 [Rattus norvegicus]